MLHSHSSILTYHPTFGDLHVVLRRMEITHPLLRKRLAKEKGQRGQKEFDLVCIFVVDSDELIPMHGHSYFSTFMKVI